MNARSMKDKMTDIKACFENIDVFGVCESWLNQTIPDAKINWSGSTIFRLDRVTDRAGGLVTYIKNEISGYVTVVDNACIINDDIEILTTSICIPNHRRKLICNIYRPPGGNRKRFVDHLDNILEGQDTINVDLWLGGDYNIDFAKKGDNKYK